MAFLAPWFLAGLIAVAVPLIIHLRRSRRATRIVFSTTRFFDDRFIRSARRARLQDRLLMLLRMLLLALLALALARPALRLPGISRLFGLGGGKRVVALVVDDSASMGATGPGGALLDRARDAALAVLDDCSALNGDEATVILAGRRDTGPVVLFEKPTVDLAAVRDALEAIEVTDLATDLGGGVRKALEVIGAAEGSASRGGLTREVYVFSDMQATGLEDGLLAPGPLAGLMFVAPGAGADAAADNLCVEAVQYGAARPLLGVPFAFRALVTNHGDEPRNAVVRLQVGEETVARKRVTLPPGRGQVVRFTHRFTRAGWSGGFVAVDVESGAAPDALESDNRRHFALQVRDHLRILAVNGAASEVAVNDELFFFRAALQAASAERANDASAAPVHIEETDVPGITPDRVRDTPLVLLANVGHLPAPALETLEAYVDRGGSLLVTLGDRVEPAAYDDWTGAHRLHGGLLPGRLTGTVEPSDPHAAGGSNFIAAVDNTHPAMAGFGDGQLGSLNTVRLYRYAVVESDEAAVILRDAAGRPLLLEKRFGRGRVMLFAGTIDRDGTNFPLQPAFVPWVYRLTAYLSQGGLDRAGFVPTGRLVRLPAPATRVEPMQIGLPGGGTGYPVPDPDAPAGSPGSAFGETVRAGVYAVRTAGEREPFVMFAANIPEEESIPVLLDKEDMASRVDPAAAWVFVDDPADVVPVSRAARQGFGLWDHLLALALVVAVAEPWIANRLSRRRTGGQGTVKVE